MMDEELRRTRKINLLLAPLIVLVFAGLLAMMYGWVGTNKSVGNERRELPEGTWVAAQVPAQQAHHLPTPFDMGIGNGQMQMINTPGAQTGGQQAHHLPAPVDIGIGNGQMQLINTPGAQTGGQQAHHLPAPADLGIGSGINGQMQLIDTPGYPIGIGTTDNRIRLVNQAFVYMGMRLGTVDAGRAQQMGLAAQPLLIVQEITPNLPAAKAGIERGDFIFSLDHQDVASIDQLAKVLSFRKPGDTIKVMYIHNGRKKSTHLTLEAPPAMLPAAAIVGPPWLGVDIQNVDAVMQSQFNLANKHGAIISQIAAGSPAAAAGLVKGDVITSYNGKQVRDVKELQKRIAKSTVGQPVVVEFIRGGAPQVIYVAPGSVPAPSNIMPKVPPAEMVVEGSWIGMDVSELAAANAAELGFAEGTSGILVNDVEGPPALTVGFQTGDLITAINGTPTLNMKEFVRATRLQSGAVVDILRGDRHIFITVPPPGFTQQGTKIDPGPANNFRQVAAVNPLDQRRVAILVTGPGLDAQVTGEQVAAPPYLLMADLQQNSFTVIQPANSGILDDIFRQNEVAVLICSHISQRNAARYTAMGVVVYSGVVGQASDAIQMYSSGQLTAN